MAEESPISSPSTSPSSLKRRITDSVTPPLDTFQTRPLTLPLSTSPEVGPSVLEVALSILEVGVNDETQSVQYPKKPKFEPLTEDEFLQDSEIEKLDVNFEEMLSLDVIDNEVQSELDKNDMGIGLIDEFHQVSAKFSGFDGKFERQDSGYFGEFEEVGIDFNDVSVVGLEKMNEDFELKDEFLRFSTKISGFNEKCERHDSGNLNVIEQLGMDLNEVSEVESDKRISEEKVEFLGIKDEKSTENSMESAISEKKAENFDGFMRKMEKSEELANSLKIEMIDGTLMLDVEGNDLVGDDSVMEGKRNRRRGKTGNGRNSGDCVAGGSSGGGTRKSVYSRKDMEGMRYANSKGQKKLWNEIYSGFSDAAKEEYDGLGSFKHQQTGGAKKKCSNGGFMGSCSTVPSLSDREIMGESCSGNVSCDTEIICFSSLTYEGDTSSKDGDDLVGEWTEDEESDDEYESIRRPAFKVEGEPNFQSGPPEDGMEYLRRVRWEAKKIPKVKVAKLNNIKVKDQSVYMPLIPDIEECPPHLVPLTTWEDEFIADFSELRMALLRLEDTSDAGSVDSESIIFGREHKRCPSQNLTSLQLTSGAPTLSSVLAMDPVTRITALRKRISLFQSASDLSKDDCAWLFALCAAVDTPLDADACASLRCLFRSCAKLRAGKEEVDDDVIMLNVLATISGRFFGQSGN